MEEKLDEGLLDAFPASDPQGHRPDDLSDEAELTGESIYDDGVDIADQDEPQRPESGLVPEPPPDDDEDEAA